MLADDVRYVIGVDTHADGHTLALVEVATQRRRRALTITASRRGYRRALRLARRQAPGCCAWALEGTGSYGAGLARFLSERGEQVLEVERPRREGRRGRLKSDALDAERAARLLPAEAVESVRPRRVLVKLHRTGFAVSGAGNQESVPPVALAAVTGAVLLQEVWAGGPARAPEARAESDRILASLGVVSTPSVPLP
jgi:hypothetical protein